MAPIAETTFSPDSVLGGRQVAVALRAANGGDFALARLSVQEPADGEPDLLAQGLAFEGWNSDALEWPLGATHAHVSFWYDGEADFAPPVIIARPAVLPAPDPAAGSIRGFRVDFTGSMTAGQYAALSYVAATEAVEVDTTTTNTIWVEAQTLGADPQTASAFAADDLTRRAARVDTYAASSAAPSTLNAVPGTVSMLSISAGVAPQPASPEDAGGSTVGADRLVIVDPVGAGSGFWDAFALTRILATDVPAGSRLTVEYLDLGASPPAWTELASPSVGPQLFGHVLTVEQRSALGGVRFSYEPVGQPTLPPGFDVSLHLRVALQQAGIDADAAEDYPVLNVVESLVESSVTTPSTATKAGELTMMLRPAPAPGDGSGPGTLPMAEKEWLDHPLNGLAVSARSGDEARAMLRWGTGGLEFHSVRISDSALDPAAPGYDVANSVFEAFDLVEISRISNSMDPLLRYDRVVAIELFIPGSGWVPTSTDPCEAGACDGAFPGYALDPTERALARGVRVVVEESPTRADRLESGGSSAPPVDSGVAQSTEIDREIELVFAIRDERRSDGAPVLGSNRGSVYNGSAPGWVENTVRVEGRDADGEVLYHDVAGHEIQILDHALNVTVSKDWLDGTLGVPPAGTPASLFPQARMSITATNATVVRVDELVVTEPGLAGPGAVPDPFEHVNLVRIASVSIPDGATSSRIFLEPTTSYPDSYTIASALALDAADLADATGIRVVHEGRIAPGATTSIELHTQLREFLRNDAETRVGVDHSPLRNSVLAEVRDLGGSWPGEEPAPEPGVVMTAVDEDDAEIRVESIDPAVVATKLITAGTSATPTAPAIQYDGDTNTATVSLRGRPAGNVRYTEMVFEDLSPTFWNAYVFSGFSAHSFVSPIDRVRVDALVGVDYTIGDGNSLEVSGGTWERGEPGTVLTLPDGVSADQVRGLRITYTRDDDRAWERPYNPEQTAVFTVERRDDLLTGGPVPSTLHVYDAIGTAPGETQRSTFTNALTVTVNARATPDGDVLWTAEETDVKQLRFAHRPAKAEIRKSPSGPIYLGDSIDFRIDVHNFGGPGDRVLSGVVVTDLLPIDASGAPFLVYRENSDTGERLDPSDPADVPRIFRYELRNAAGVLQPAPDVDLVVDAVPSAAFPPHHQPRLTFSLAEEQTIPLGWTLTIASVMEFRSLLEAGTEVTNVASVISDREFDSCGRHYRNNAEVVPGSLDDGAPPYLMTPSCATSTTVEPLPSAPLLVTKGVKGLGAGPLEADGVTVVLDDGGNPYDDLGIVKVAPSSPVDCAIPNAQISINGGGFYRYPCVPITRPGSEHQWATTFTNSGNVSVRQVVAIDVLPRPGDTGVTIPSPRGSQWTPRLSSYPIAHGLPEGGALTVLYTDRAGMASSRCNGADIQHTMGMTRTSTPPMLASYQSCLTDTSATDEIPDRVWNVLPEDAPEVWADAVALKFIVLMDDSQGLDLLLAPTGSISISYESTTALVPELVETEDDLGAAPVAYNSIASAATGRVYPDDEEPLDLAYRLVTEPRKVGVALAVGEVELRKDNAGAAAAAYAPAAVDVALSCRVEGEPIALLDSSGDDRSVVRLTPGTTRTVAGIPLYAVCEAAEIGDYGQTSVVTDPEPVVLIAHAAHDEGALPVTDPQPPFGDGPGGGAHRPAIERGTITNDYPAAQLVVGKTVETNGAENQNGIAIAYTPPVFSVSCRFDNGVADTEIFAVTGITIAHGTTVTFPRPSTSDPVLPAGADCVVTETNTRDATSTQYTVTTGEGAGTPVLGTSATVTLTPDGVGDAATNRVDFVNSYGVGTFTVSKTLDGLGAAIYGTGTFTVQLSCTRASATPSTTIWSGSFTLEADDPTRVIDKLPAGSVCTVSEPGAAGATSTTFSPQRSGVSTEGRATVPNGSNATVTITNIFDLARLAVTKEVRTDAEDAAGSPVYPLDAFEIRVACEWQGAERVADGFDASPMVLSGVQRGETRVLEGLPAGASCTVTEVDIPIEVDSTSIEWQTSAGSGTAPEASETIILTRDTAPDTGSNTARVVNRYAVAALTVIKDVRGGAGAQFGTGPFLIDVVCTAPGDVPAYNGTVSLPGGTAESPVWFATIDTLPENSVCSVEERDVAETGADASRILDADGDVVAGTGIEVGTDAVEVTIENWYLTGSVTVGKRTTGDAAAEYGDGPFSMTVDCVREVDGVAVQVDGFPATQSLRDGETATFTGLPSRAECSLTESDAGGATDSWIVLASDSSHLVAGDATTGHVFTVTVDPDQLVDDQPQTAYEVINEFRLAGLVVTKTVQSDAVDQDGRPIEYGPFPVAVSCSFQGQEVYADGYSSASPMEHSFSQGDPAWGLTGLVVGADCVVEESDRQGSSSSRISVTPSGGATVNTLAGAGQISVGAPVSLAVREAGDDENRAAIRNDYASGTITLEKALAGAGTAWATEDFEIELVCTLPDGPVDPVVWSSSYVVSSDDLEIPDLAGVAAGADCVVTERAAGGATSTAISIDGVETGGVTVSFASPSGATARQIVVTNTFRLAQIDVRKERSGDAAAIDAYGVGPFQVALSCTREVDGNVLDLAIPGPATPIPGVSDPSIRRLDAAGLYRASYEDLPVGAQCVLTEPRTGGATSTSIAPGALALAAGTNEVVVENEFASGSLVVGKERTGPGAVRFGAGPFYVSLSCIRDVDGTTVAVDIPAPAIPIAGVTDPAIRELGATGGYTAEYVNLPAGAECTVTETGTGGATSTVVSDLEPAVIPAAGVSEVTVTNDFAVGSLEIVKERIFGPGSEVYGDGPFEVALTCRYLANGEWRDVDLGGDALHVLDAGNSYAATVTGILVGAECTVEETDAGLAISSELRPADGTVTISDATTPARIVVTNRFFAGKLDITKSSSAPMVQGGMQYDYEIDVENTGHVDAAGVVVVDELDPLLRVVRIDAPGWSSCEVTGAGSDGFGGTLECEFDGVLAVGTRTPLITVTVFLEPEVKQNTVSNEASVSSTTFVVEGDRDSATVDIKWLDVTAVPQCISDAPWLYYTVDAHNLGLGGRTMTIEWLDSLGAIVTTDTVDISADGTLSGRLLWPGADISPDGEGIAWPGWRPALPGETPDWENLVLDSTLPEYALREGAQVRIVINPEAVIEVDYPPATSSCVELPDDRVADAWLTKTADATRVVPGGAFEYKITGGNRSLGTLRDVVVTDEIPEILRVLEVHSSPASPHGPQWASCAVSDRLPSGYGGTLECLLDRPLGALQSIPEIRLDVRLSASAEEGSVLNVARLEAVDPSIAGRGAAPVITAEDSAESETDPGRTDSPDDESETDPGDTAVPAGSAMTVPTFTIEDSVRVWTIRDLAGTGATVSPWIVAAILAVIAGGAVLLLTARRRADRDRRRDADRGGNR